MCGGGAKGVCVKAGNGMRTRNATETDTILRHFCVMAASSLVKRGTDRRGLRIQSAEQRFYRPFFLEQCLERKKVPHQPQYVAYHSIVQPYVCRVIHVPRST